MFLGNGAWTFYNSPHLLRYNLQLTKGTMKSLSLFQMYGRAEIKQWPLIKSQGVPQIYNASMAIMWHPSKLDPKHQNQRT